MVVVCVPDIYIYIILTKTMYSPLLGRGLVGLFGLCGVDEFS